MSCKLDLVLARKGSVRPVQIRQFSGRKRQRSHSRHRPRNPSERFFFLRHTSRRIRGRPRLARNHNLAVFVRASFGKLLVDFLQLFQNVAAFRFQFLCFQF